MDLSYRSWRVWQRNLDVFLKLWRSEVPGFLVEPVIILLAMGVGLGTYVFLGEEQEYFAFIAPGIVASYAMLLLAGHITFGNSRDHHYHVLPKWRRNAKRPSCADLVNRLRLDLQARDDIQGLFHLKIAS